MQRRANNGAIDLNVHAAAGGRIGPLIVQMVERGGRRWQRRFGPRQR
jgi:hypothetical protein